MKRTKKIAVLILLIAALLCVAGCGGGNKSKLVGFWQAVETDNEDLEYGIGMEFRKDGTMYIGLSSTDLAEYAEMSEKEMDEALEAMGYLYKITYKVKSETVMEVTISAFMGLAKESTEVEYSLDGDKLVFDGAVYKRMD